MTGSEQKIFDEIVKLREQQAVLISKLKDISKDVYEHDKDIRLLVSDRNKVIGISWLGGGLLAIGSVIYEIFKHS